MTIIPEEVIGRRLRTAFRTMASELDTVLSATDISLPQWLALKLLREGDAHCVGDIGRSLDYNSGSATRLMDHLEKRGFVRRIRDRTDRRMVLLEITPAGLAIGQATDPVILEFWKMRLSVFTQVERRTLVDLLGRLTEALTAPSDPQFNTEASPK